MDKINALKCSKGNVVAHMVISEKGVSEMQWWLCNLDGNLNPIRHPQVDVTLYSDAYLAEWGAVINDISTGRRWSVTEANSLVIFWQSYLLFGVFMPRFLENMFS